MNFLLSNGFQSSWILAVLLVVALIIFNVLSNNSRKKAIKEREEFLNQISKGTKIRTFGGLYGTILSIRKTTDGKVILVETGEGDKKSYQELHIEAIESIDYSEDVVINAEGEEVPLSELNKPKEEVKEEVSNEQSEEKSEESIEVETVEETVEK